MRSIILATILATTLGLAAGSVKAADGSDGLNGEGLFTLCNGDAGVGGEDICLFLIMGVVEGIKQGAFIVLIRTEGFESYEVTNKRYQQIIGYCIPSNVNNGQIKRIVAKFLNDHPERLHEPPAFIIVDALTGAFPCPKP